MTHLSNDKVEKMRRSYRRDVAEFLRSLALDHKTLTYGELTDRFGRGPRNWGDPLSGIALVCKDTGVPILSVLVVNKRSGLPSLGAVIYKDMGMIDEPSIRQEMQRCFDHDWSHHPGIFP